MPSSGRHGQATFQALLQILDPGVVTRADAGPSVVGRSREIRGAEGVAAQALDFRALASGARPATINGAAGLVVFAGDRPFAILAFAFRGTVISGIDILLDPERLRRMDLTAVSAG